MRVTIHLGSRADYWPFALATRPARRQRWATPRGVARADYWPFALAARQARRKRWLTAERDAPTPAAMAGAARRLRRALAGGGTLRRPEIDALVGKQRARGVGLWLDMVRVPPSGTWE